MEEQICCSLLEAVTVFPVRQYSGIPAVGTEIDRLKPVFRVSVCTQQFFSSCRILCILFPENTKCTGVLCFSGQQLLCSGNASGYNGLIDFGKFRNGGVSLFLPAFFCCMVFLAAFVIHARQLLILGIL